MNFLHYHYLRSLIHYHLLSDNYYLMKISIWSIGKNNEPYIKTGVEEFTIRISKYYKVEWNIIPVPKNAVNPGRI